MARKLQVHNVREKTTVPFLRGILVHSLQNAGLGFSQAHQIANRVKSDLEPLPVITTAQLKEGVIFRLHEAGLDQLVPAYRRPRRDYAVQVVDGDGRRSDFSMSEYRSRLDAIGLRTGEAEQIALAFAEHLMLRKVRRISTRHISRLTYRYLRRSEQFGPAVARRWLIWQDFVQSGRPLMLLIAGTAGSGKSTIAADVASHLAIGRTQSTDILREVIRSMISEREQPLLHRSSFAAWTGLPASAREALTDPDELLIEGYRRQAAMLTPAIEAVIRRADRESVSLVMEGVHINPTLMSALPRADSAVVVPVLLAVVKRKILRERICGRSSAAPQRRSRQYLEHFDSIWKLQSHFLAEAEDANIPIVINDSRERVFREIMLATIAILGRGFTRSPQQVFGER
jgi:2-phosphoglycerate kinase